MGRFKTTGCLKKNIRAFHWLKKGRGQRERKASKVLWLVGCGIPEEHGLGLPSMFDPTAEVPEVSAMDSRVRD